MLTTMRNKLLSVALVGLVGLWGCSSLSAATVDDLLNEVNQALKPDEISEPGNPARAQAIASLLSENLGLSAAEMIELRIAGAEAWLDAGRLPEVKKSLEQVFSEKEIPSSLRDRAGLAMVAMWQLSVRQAEDPSTIGSVLDLLQTTGDHSAVVIARAHSAAAQRIQLGLSDMRRALPPKPAEGEPEPPITPEQQAYLDAVTAMLKHLDTALELLSERPPEDRMPVYALRILGMEEGGMKGDAIQAWLQQHIKDPAAAQLLDSAISASEKFIGQKAPPLKLKRVDGQEEIIDLATMNGKPVLIDFFATWCKPCEKVGTNIAGAAVILKKQGIETIGVTLDTKETMANLPAWIARMGITYPIVGEGIGWDSEIDDAWRVDGIPAIVLVSADGRVLANEQSIIGKDAEETAAIVMRLLQDQKGGGLAADPNGKPAENEAPKPGEADKPAAKEPGFIP